MMRFEFMAVVVGCLVLVGCHSGITSHPLELPMKHSEAEKDAVDALNIQKNTDYVLPANDKVVHDSLYDKDLVIPEDLRAKDNNS